MVLLNFIFETLSILLILVGIFIIILDIRLWYKNELNTLKAKVFLDKNFLKNNFIIFSIIGLSIGYHVFIETVQYGRFQIPSSIRSIAFILYYGSLLVGLACIPVMGITWHNLLKKNTK
jgi:hypothetical protein